MRKKIYLFIIGSILDCNLDGPVNQNIVNLNSGTVLLFIFILYEKDKMRNNYLLLGRWFLGKMLTLAGGFEWCLCWDFWEAICLIILTIQDCQWRESPFLLFNSTIISLSVSALGWGIIRSDHFTVRVCRSQGFPLSLSPFINLQIREDCGATDTN